jgi:hypothetical protein
MHLCHDHLMSEFKSTLIINSTHSDTLRVISRKNINPDDQHV